MNILLETAKLAKEKGFNEPSTHFYVVNFSSFKEDGKLKKWGEDNFFQVQRLSKGQPHLALAPTQSELQKWIREVLEINVESNYLPNADKYSAIYVPKSLPKPNTFNNTKEYLDSRSKFYSNINFDTYEEALEEGLIKALKFI